MSPPRPPPTAPAVKVTEVDARPRRQTNPGVAPPASGSVAPPLEDVDEDTAQRALSTLSVRHGELTRQLAEKSERERELLREVEALKVAASAKPAAVEPDDDFRALLERVALRLLGKHLGLALLLALGGAVPGTYVWTTRAQGEGARVTLEESVKQIAAAQAELKAQQAKSVETEAQRWRVVMAFQCMQGLRAAELGDSVCAAIREKADFAAQPLDSKAPPTWKTRLEWPAIPPPPQK